MSPRTPQEPPMRPSRPPLYHLSMSVVRRSQGRSAVAAAAYRSASRMIDLRTGLTADYTLKQHVTPLPLFLPPGVAAVERERFWNAVETHNRRKDAVVAREIDAALPRGLSRDQEAALAERFGQWLASTYGVAVDIGVHRMPDNPHLDVLLSSNAVLADGGLGKKVRELDAVARQRVKGLPNPTETIRAMWAQLSNQALAEAGQQARVDHRSYERQGVPLKPTFHLGRALTAIEKRAPGSTEAGARLLAIKTENERLQQEEPHHERPQRKPGKPRAERQTCHRRPRAERQPRPGRRPRRPGLPVEVYLPGAPAPVGAAAAPVSGSLEPRAAGRDSRPGSGAAPVVGGPGDAKAVRAPGAGAGSPPAARREAARAGLGGTKPQPPDSASPRPAQGRGAAAAATGRPDPRRGVDGLPPEPAPGGVGSGAPGAKPGLAAPGTAAPVSGPAPGHAPRPGGGPRTNRVAGVDQPRSGSGRASAGDCGAGSHGGRIAGTAARGERAAGGADDGGHRAQPGAAQHGTPHSRPVPSRGDVGGRDAAARVAELDAALRAEVDSINWEIAHRPKPVARPRPQEPTQNLPGPKISKPGR